MHAPRTGGPAEVVSLTGGDLLEIKHEAAMGDGLSTRDRLVRLLEEGSQGFDFELTDDTSLIRSGLIDSLGLFNLALWIEKEVHSKLDLASLDPSKEWDTIPDILNFIAKHRGG